MDKQEFLREEFSALRREIDATKTRLFRTLALALVVVPAVTYFASKPEAFILGLIVPFLVLVFTMLFVAEEHALMRCGRYVRERIEAKVADGAGWEGWLEAQPHLRAMDKYLLACFVITLFVFYFGSVALAIAKLWTSGDTGISGEQKAIAGAVVYAIGAIWMLVTVVHHWRAATTTSGA